MGSPTSTVPSRYGDSSRNPRARPGREPPQPPTAFRRQPLNGAALGGLVFVQARVEVVEQEAEQVGQCGLLLWSQVGDQRGFSAEHAVDLRGRRARRGKAWRHSGSVQAAARIDRGPNRGTPLDHWFEIDVDLFVWGVAGWVGNEQWPTASWRKRWRGRPLLASELADSSGARLSKIVDDRDR